MSHIKTNKVKHKFKTLAEYRSSEMSKKRWKNVTLGISNHDLDNNFEFLNSAVLNRSADHQLLQTTTGLFGPIRPGTIVYLNNKNKNPVVDRSDRWCTNYNREIGKRVW